LNGIRYPVVELRQYTLHPGRRDVLIDLFDREFVETQEAAGMAVLGQFRDLDDSDRFVWLRGFDDMRRRAPAFRPPPPPGPALPVCTGENAFVWFARFRTRQRSLLA
jgi:hypothetical protein